MEKEIMHNEKERIKTYLVICNIQKNNNVGNMLRGAVAFGFDAVLVVGMNKINFFGSKGTERGFLPIIQFRKLPELKEWLKEREVHLCGVEIVKEAVAVNKHPFRGHTAIMLGNEGSGMNEKQIATCDHFVYIPQYGKGTHSLNVNVAASICMHHLSLWAGYDESAREEDRAKFVVEEPDRSIPLERNEVDKEIQLQREEQKRDNVIESENTLSNLSSLYYEEGEEEHEDIL